MFKSTAKPALRFCAVVPLRCTLAQKLAAVRRQLNTALYFGGILKIRKLTVADWAEYKKFRIFSLQESPQSFESSVNDEISLTDDMWKSRVSNTSSAFVLGAFMDSKLVGAAGFIREKKEKVIHKSVIWGVFVDSACRGKGVASKLLDFIMSEAKSTNGLDNINLTVSSENTIAIGLYQKLGFKQYGFEIDTMRINGVSYDEILMCYVKAKI